MRVAVIGLGSIGLGIACSLRRAGHEVVGVDVAPDRRAAFEREGGPATGDARAAVADAPCVICAVVNAAQTEAVLFGESGVADAMAAGRVFVSCATIPPESARDLAERVERLGVHYLDAPTSGGEERAMRGETTLIAAGKPEAFAAVGSTLEDFTAAIYRVGDAPGAGSAMKLVNQLLAGVHIAAAGEAVAFAARMGLDLRQVYEVITNAAGNSWMFENRVPRVLEGDYAPRSAVSIFTKDLGLVLDAARAATFPVPMASAGLQLFEMTAAAGMGQEDDISVARLYARIAGLSLPGDSADGPGS